MRCEITTREGVTHGIELSPREGLSSQYVFSLHKSGSVLLNSIVRELADVAGACYFDLPGSLFSLGLSMGDIRGPGVPPVLQLPGVCYGGFREYPETFGLEIAEDARFVYLVRDPRDILVSLYFSFAYSHPVPREGVVKDRLTRRKERALELGIDRYVLEYAPEQLAEIRGYNEKLLPILGTRGMLFRYEDVIFKKKDWIEEICRIFDWNVPARTIAEIADRHDVRPATESPSDHIRRVVPGDHREKLRPETIETLNGIFSDTMKLLGYGPAA